MSVENKALFDKIMNMFETGDTSRAGDLVAANALDHNPMPGIGNGLDGFKQTVKVVHDAFPDRRSTTTVMVADGDKVAAVVSSSGTHRGEFMGVPATGKVITAEENHFMRFENGKAVEHWGLIDVMGTMQQLGVIPGH